MYSSVIVACQIISVLTCTCKFNSNLLATALYPLVVPPQNYVTLYLINGTPYTYVSFLPFGTTSCTGAYNSANYVNSDNSVGFNTGNVGTYIVCEAPNIATNDSYFVQQAPTLSVASKRCVVPN